MYALANQARKTKPEVHGQIGFTQSDHCLVKPNRVFDSSGTCLNKQDVLEQVVSPLFPDSTLASLVVGRIALGIASEIEPCSWSFSFCILLCEHRFSSLPEPFNPQASCESYGLLWAVLLRDSFLDA